jgi:predicted flap endonuclease-1-like 5' DNA nuclease
MPMLFRIIYATKARGTHHKLALDALNQIEAKDAEHWRRLFLKHIDVYLEGAKAPDDEFKDFKNHVLHVSDEFWGGAPQMASAWYDKLVRALAGQQFEEAVYCAGVLSHYYVDPLHPFHTGQSEAENNIHRAVEWSIAKSYDMLRARGLRDHPGLTVAAGDGPGWIEDMVRRGAARAHQHYDALLSNYNFDRGVVDPLEGLNDTCHRFLAELLVYAATGYASILDRAILQAAVSPPLVELTLETFVAALSVPMSWVLRKLADAEDRRAVEAVYDELRTTGKVEHHLAEDDRAVRDLHRLEVLEHRRISPVVTAIAAARAERRLEQVQQAEAAPDAVGRSAAAPAEASTPTAVSTIAATVSRPGEKHHYLTLDDAVDKAPSIGLKTAERLAEAGVATVRDLLAVDALDLSTRLNARWISESLIRGWQDQARLACEIVGLRGRHAALLVGAGLRTRRAITGMTAGEIRALLVLFCQTRNGMRLHGCESVPELDEVQGWVEAAAAAPRPTASAAA